MSVVVRVDDCRDPRVVALIEAHLADMRAISPPDSVHALDVDAIRGAGVTVFTAWRPSVGGTLVGCGAVKLHPDAVAEVKTMRTVAAHRGTGIASAVLEALVSHARSHGCTRVALETGSTEAFASARRFYERRGFATGAPFADYGPDPHSVFMHRSLN